MKTILETVLQTFTKDVYDIEYGIAYNYQLRDDYFLYIRNDIDYKMLTDLVSNSISNRGVHVNELYVDRKGEPYKIQYDKYRNMFIVNGIDVPYHDLTQFISGFYDLLD